MAAAILINLLIILFLIIYLRCQKYISSYILFSLNSKAHIVTRGNEFSTFYIEGFCFLTNGSKMLLIRI